MIESYLINEMATQSIIPREPLHAFSGSSLINGPGSSKCLVSNFKLDSARIIDYMHSKEDLISEPFEDFRQLLKHRVHPDGLQATSATKSATHGSVKARFPIC